MYVGFNTVPLYMRSDESVMTQRFQLIVALLMSMFLGKTLTVPLFTPVYEPVPANLIIGVTLQKRGEARPNGPLDS